MMRWLILSSVLGAGCLAANDDPARAELPAASSFATSGLRPLQPDDVLAAMYRALGTREAKIELVEVSHFPAPEGELEFGWKDLARPVSPQTPTRWRGSVRYDGNRRFAVWAMVRLRASCRRVVATVPLRPEEPIRPSQVREETYEGFPSDKDLAWRLADVIGRVSIRPVPLNGPVTPEMLKPPAVVSKGAMITAEYNAGGLRLSLTVIAERAGRVGEMILVRNPSSRKIFLARVTDGGVAVVEDSPRGAHAGDAGGTRP